ncbi:MAG: response regulator containing CheY-like receiver domain and AraC-type DNA-binding domain [Rhodocyclales bacterium]|nr:response regulator containing CheY-like receiver domain and AraC-type DNA-binding domain [Rhodocyclales bacterium]
MATEQILKNLTVLVVDDNDTTRAMLRGILRQEGADVVGEAKDGLTAIAACHKLKPKLVCLDVLMPNSHGVDVLKEIRNELPEIKVLMVTGSADRETVQAAIQAGASGYVVKPFNASRVVNAVLQACQPTDTARSEPDELPK